MPDIRVRGLTICQPWASLIAWGDKRVENRSWYTDYRGPLLIHAGKNEQYLRRYGDTRDVPGPRPLPLGRIVATAELVGCLRIDRVRKGIVWPRFSWVARHPYTEGRWCWVLEDVRPLDEPLAWSGWQGLWDAAEACRAIGIPHTFDPDESQVPRG